MNKNKIKYDKEYQTMFLQEFRWLEKNGIKPSFIKDIEGTRFYKYEKTPKLFELLRIFYVQKDD